MKPNPKFQAKDPVFWANIRTISQAVGYTVRQKNKIKIPTQDEIRKSYALLDLSWEHLYTTAGAATSLGQQIESYFEYRARALEEYIEPQLMDVEQARELFARMVKEYSPKRPFPKNKQKGEKSGPALLTSMVNMVIESIAGDNADYDPRTLTTVTNEGLPVRTLSRRVDGGLPSVVNPVAIWEIKEYYFTTTFGSRVADGVYETMLDGLELRELELSEGTSISHCLIVDSHFTWWVKGKSYLCRLVDMLHMGLVDQIIFGREVANEFPSLVQEWQASTQRRYHQT